MSFTIDTASLLVEVPGAATLAAVEAALAPHGLSLGVPIGETTVAAWLAAGAPGAPSVFADPADHLVAGLVATLEDGRSLAIRPAPRRAVGPDLVTLFVGTHERCGTIDRVWLRITKKGMTRPSMALPVHDLDPPISAAESALFDAIACELLRDR